MKLSNRNTIRTSPDWTVWRGEEAGGKQLHLVKQANEKSAYRPQLLARLADEYKFLDQFHHPHLLRPAWIEADAGRAGFADAQCNLAQYVEVQGRIAPTLVANVLAMAADGLDHLHARGFGHGAVGSPSLYVTPTGTVAFADFLGYSFRSTAPVPVPDPEPRYQAPELIDATLGKPGPTADLYCLGFLALELLTGSKFAGLFGVADGSNWLAWHADPYKELADWRPTLGNAPDGLVEVIAGLIPKRPDDREFQSAAQLRSFLIKSRLTSDERLPYFGRKNRTGPIDVFRPPVRERTAKLPSKVARKPRLTLHPIDGIGEPRTLSPKRAALVGHGPGCDLHCRGKAVSPKHALLVCGQDGVWRVYDISTGRVTFVNGYQMRQSKLCPEDELYLGEYGLRVELNYAVNRRQLDQFELVSKLHVGSRGTVYRAKWATKSGREVAVRVFPKRFQFDTTGLKRLLRGVPEMAQVRHPNLVPVFRAGSERVGKCRAWFVATEYMPRGTLRDRLSRGGRLPAAEAAKMVREAAAGAKAIADRGLVHRVINPGCVFAGDTNAKLGDFFFARPTQVQPGQEVTAYGANELTDLVYQAPECVRGGTELTPACDVYSLGATLYEAVAGRPPFDPKRPMPEVCDQVLGGAPAALAELAPKVPDKLAEVIARAMEKDPAHRYADAGELAAALARF